jgi:hypothetical protein
LIVATATTLIDWGDESAYPTEANLVFDFVLPSKSKHPFLSEREKTVAKRQ